MDKNLHIMNRQAHRGLLKYFQSDDDFIVSHDEKSDLYTVRYSHTGVDWDKPWIMRARGLVIDKEGNIVSQPYQKFFNYQQYTPENRPPFIKADFAEYYCDFKDGEKYDILEKLDGTMLAITNYNGELLPSTTMNVNSKYALLGLSCLKKQLNESQIIALTEMCKNATFIFEYTAPDNRIVVDYDVEKMTLHGIMSLTEEKLLDYSTMCLIADSLGLPVINRLGRSENVNFDFFLRKLKQAKNFEGVVLRFKDGRQLKIKTDDYLEKHSTVSLFFGNLNTKAKNKMILDMIRDETVDDVLAYMVQQKHASTVTHIERVVDKYNDAMVVLKKAKAIVENSTFNRAEYFTSKPSHTLEASLVGALASKKLNKIDDIIETSILNELKGAKP